MTKRVRTDMRTQAIPKRSMRSYFAVLRMLLMPLSIQ